MKPRGREQSGQHPHARRGMIGRKGAFLGCLLTLLSGFPALAQQPSIEGTYRFVARKLSDGTIYWEKLE